MKVYEVDILREKFDLWVIEQEEKNREAYKVAKKTSSRWLVTIAKGKNTSLVSESSRIKYNPV